MSENGKILVAKARSVKAEANDPSGLSKPACSLFELLFSDLRPLATAHSESSSSSVAQLPRAAGKEDQLGRRVSEDLLSTELLQAIAHLDERQQRVVQLFLLTGNWDSIALSSGLSLTEAQALLWESLYLLRVPVNGTSPSSEARDGRKSRALSLVHSRPLREDEAA